MVQVTTTESLRQRIGSAIGGLLFAPILLLVGAVVLFGNEGRAVQRAKALEEGRAAVVSVKALDAANEGKLVHVVGRATTTETLEDPQFPIAVQALELERTVEMFQWREKSSTKTETKVGGGQKKVTTYTYEQDWSTQLIDSSRFQESSGHQNPTRFPFDSESLRARKVTLDEFALSDGLISKIGGATPVPVPGGFPPRVGSVPATVQGNAVHLGSDPDRPTVGDVRLRWSAILPGEISVVGGQAGDLLSPYSASNGGVLALVQRGTVGADAMFDTAVASNRVLTWALRFLGFVVCFVAVRTVFYPIPVFADVVPFFGRLAGVGVFAVSFLLAAIVSLTTIAVAWIFFRPLLGGLLMAGIGGLTFLLIRQLRSARQPEAVELPPVPVPQSGA
ncbi:MAG: TMEM43 family protein [Acidobacteriota bacterium]